MELEPDVIVPSQYWPVDRSLSAEKRLMLAVLTEAVATFHRTVRARDRIGKRLFAEADEWFASEDTQWPFAFVNLCDALGLEADYVRSGLRRWREGHHTLLVSGKPLVRIVFRRMGSGPRHRIGEAALYAARRELEPLSPTTVDCLSSRTCR